jgi:hypothetical protein
MTYLPSSIDAMGGDQKGLEEGQEVERFKVALVDHHAAVPSCRQPFLGSGS